VTYQPPVVDRSSVDNALEAANVALLGKRARDTRRLTSIELREVDSRRAAWELALVTTTGVVTLAIVLALLLR
jgi:hypothetical protein